MSSPASSYSADSPGESPSGGGTVPQATLDEPAIAAFAKARPYPGIPLQDEASVRALAHMRQRQQENDRQWGPRQLNASLSSVQSAPSLASMPLSYAGAESSVEAPDKPVEAAQEFAAARKRHGRRRRTGSKDNSKGRKRSPQPRAASRETKATPAEIRRIYATQSPGGAEADPYTRSLPEDVLHKGHVDLYKLAHLNRSEYFEPPKRKTSLTSPARRAEAAEAAAATEREGIRPVTSPAAPVPVHTHKPRLSATSGSGSGSGSSNQQHHDVTIQDLKRVPSTWNTLLEFYKSKCNLTSDAEAEERIRQDLAAGHGLPTPATAARGRKETSKQQPAPAQVKPKAQVSQPRPKLEPLPKPSPIAAKKTAASTSKATAAPNKVTLQPLPAAAAPASAHVPQRKASIPLHSPGTGGEEPSLLGKIEVAVKHAVHTVTDLFTASVDDGCGDNLEAPVEDSKPKGNKDDDKKPDGANAASPAKPAVPDGLFKVAEEKGDKFASTFVIPQASVDVTLSAEPAASGSTLAGFHLASPKPRASAPAPFAVQFTVDDGGKHHGDANAPPPAASGDADDDSYGSDEDKGTPAAAAAVAPKTEDAADDDYADDAPEKDEEYGEDEFA